MADPDHTAAPRGGDAGRAAWMCFDPNGEPYFPSTRGTREDAMQACFGAEWNRHRDRRWNHWERCLSDGWTCRSISLDATPPDRAPPAAAPGVEAMAEAARLAERLRLGIGGRRGEIEHLRPDHNVVLESAVVLPVLRLLESLARLGDPARDRVREAAAFLLARLNEFGDDAFTEDGLRDFLGHVAPPMARLRAALAEMPAGDGNKLTTAEVIAGIKRLQSTLNDESVDNLTRLQALDTAQQIIAVLTPARRPDQGGEGDA